MQTKREIEEKARGLISTNPEEAVALYKEILSNYSAEFNDWDAFYTLKALKSLKNIERRDIVFAQDIVKNYNTEKVQHNYGWLIHSHYIKNKKNDQIIRFEDLIQTLPDFSPQINRNKDNTYPCPTTISLFKLCDIYSENAFNAKKINDTLNKLDYNLLSTQPSNTINNEKGESIHASDFEKYISYKTKALLKLGEYKYCLDLCQIALTKLKKFHNNNDMWFKMRIALSEHKIGNQEKAKELLVELINTKKGNDKWYLYKNIADILYENKDYQTAWKYSIEAATTGNDPQYMIQLFLLQARILFILNRKEEGKIFAELIASILKEQDWKVKEEYKKLLNFYNISQDNLISVKDLMKELCALLDNERYYGLEKNNGDITWIHPSGKKGKITDSHGNKYHFHKKHIENLKNPLDKYKGHPVEFYLVERVNGEFVPEKIQIKEIDLTEEQKSLIGKEFKGIVKNITDYGVFIRLENNNDGLLHKNNMSNSLANTFTTTLQLGNSISVQVKRVTSKGIELKNSE